MWDGSTLGDHMHQHCSPDERETIQARLDCLAAHGGDGDGDTPTTTRQMVENLYAEERLPEHVWDELCQTLLACNEDALSVRGAIRQWGQSHVLECEIKDLDANSVYAHCVTLSRWCDRAASGRLGTPMPNARRGITRLVQRGDLAEQRQRLGGRQLSRHQMWATFDPVDTTADPLAFLPGTCQTLCACLGLAPGDALDEMLIFRYSLPDGVCPCLPTAATAAVSCPWNPQWRPAGREEPWGWTEPWADCLEAFRCPEIVHERITGSALTGLIQLLGSRLDG